MRHDERGGGLATLLASVVVLGVLAAVAISAVGGDGASTGPAPAGPVPVAIQTAMVVDRAAIASAEAVHLARTGVYAGEDDLVRAGLVAQASSYHDVVLVDGGRSFTIVCVTEQPCDEPRP